MPMQLANGGQLHLVFLVAKCRLREFCLHRHSTYVDSHIINHRISLPILILTNLVYGHHSYFMLSANPYQHMQLLARALSVFVIVRRLSL